MIYCGDGGGYDDEEDSDDGGDGDTDEDGDDGGDEGKDGTEEALTMMKRKEHSIHKKSEATIDDYINRDKDQISEGMTLTHLVSKTKKSRWAIDEAEVERERRAREPIFEMFLFAIADTLQFFLLWLESFQNFGLFAGRSHD